MKKTLIRIFLALAIAEAAYLYLVNLALNLPLAQSLINQHRPDKYAVHWANAWSWYPLRVHARGVSVNGQTSSQQWQADVLAASASVDVRHLFRKTVRIHGVDVQDIAFRLRPRSKPEKNYEKIREFFPPIEDRDPNSPAAARQPPKEGTGWKVLVDGIDVRGNHDLWLYQVRALLDGNLHGDVSYQSRGGPVSLRNGGTDVLLKSLTINRDWEASSGGSLKGSFDLTPFIPADNPGTKPLGFLTLDASLDAHVNSLGFLDFYLGEFNGLNVDGKGRLEGRLKYDLGYLTSGTDLQVEAQELSLKAAPYEVEGDGRIDIAVAAEDPKTLSLRIEFGALDARHRDDKAPLFTGTGLTVKAKGDSRVLPDEKREGGRGRFAVTIPSVQVPDLRLYQRYVPAKWDVELKGGQGALQGEAEVSTSEVRAELYLASGDADLRVKDFRFETDLDLGIRVLGGTAETASVDVSGTYLRLDGARLASTSGGRSEPWQASLAIAQGTLGVPIPEGQSGEPDFGYPSQVFRDKGFKDLLATADGQLKADLTVSDLGWINLLFPNPFDLAISGSGKIESDLLIRQGWIAKGTAMRVEPEGLKVDVLEYVAQGKGSAVLAVERGGERPDMRLDVKLSDARLKRQGEEDAVVQGVALEVSAVAGDVGFDGSGSVDGIDLRIPSARIEDMSVYNQYLPKDAPLRLLGGEADLTADVRLEPESAGGFVKLKTRGLRSLLDEQEVTGELTLDVQLKDGVPKDMQFDISGSSLILDRFKVAGGQKSFDQGGWNARFDLHEANVVWRKPLRIDVEAEIEMKDSRPIVAMFSNQRGKNSWLEKVLTVEDVRGKAELKVASDRILVPFALVGSDKIDVGAKALIDGTGREGIFFARFRQLEGIVKVKNGEKNFDILGAREKFDAYIPGETPIRLTGGDAEPTEGEPDPEAKKARASTSPGRGAGEDSRKGTYESFMGN